MEASLTCAVCLSVFENPTTLPVCSHNFCKKCILECVTKSFSHGLGYSSGGSNNNNIWRNSQLECPLCRKSNFVAEGAVNLPGNTTLAEVVKLFRSQQQQQTAGAGLEDGEEEEEVVGEAGGVRPPGAPAPGPGERELCQRHPQRKLQLFCKVCKQLACGQCVSEDHRGVFHAVNLVDMIYQEEKLLYFNNLRELRQLNNRLKVEIEETPSDNEYILDYEKEVVETKFNTILEKVEQKRKQLLDEIEKQKQRKEAERKIRLEGKRTQKERIEEYLKECEGLVNECNPVNFLKVACDLNERVKSNLAIVLPTLEKHDELTALQPHQFLIKPVMDSVSALQLTKETAKPDSTTVPGNTAGEPCADSYRFKATLKMWKQPKDLIEAKFSELRYKHYQSSRKDWNCFVAEEYSDNENGPEPSVSSLSTEVLKTPEQQPQAKLFSFGQSIKKVKKKFRGNNSGNLESRLPSSSGSATSIPAVSNSQMLLSNSSEKLKQKQDTVPSSAQSKTTLSITSSVGSLATAAASLPAALSSCTTVTGNEKTAESQQKPFPSSASGVMVANCSGSPSAHKNSSIFSNFSTGPVNPAITSGSSQFAMASSAFTLGNTLATKTGSQQPLPTSASLAFEKLNSCSTASNSTSSLTSVLHCKTTCDPPGTHLNHQNGQATCHTSSACNSKVLSDSTGTETTFRSGYVTAQSSQENSPFAFRTSAPLGDQGKSAQLFPLFNHGTEKSKFPFNFILHTKPATKSSESLRNPESLTSVTYSVVGRDVFKPFTLGQVSRGDNPNERQFSPATSRSTTASPDCKSDDTGIAMPALSLFASPPSVSTSNPTPFEQNFLTSQSSIVPLKSVTSSAESPHVFFGSYSTGSNFVDFTAGFSKEPSSAASQLQSTAIAGDVTKVKEMLPSERSISGEPVVLRGWKSLAPAATSVAAGDVSDPFTFTQVSRSDVPNLNEKPFLSTVGGLTSPSSGFKLKCPGVVRSAPSLLASTLLVSDSSSSSSFSMPLVQNVLPTQSRIKPLNPFASCAETAPVFTGTNSTDSSDLACTTSFSRAPSSTVSQQQSTVTPAEVSEVHEVRTSAVQLTAEPPKLDRAHPCSLKCEDLTPAISQQQGSDQASSDSGGETCELKETSLVEMLTPKPELFHRTESTGSACVYFRPVFGNYLSSVSQQQTQVASIDVAIKTCKTKEASAFEVPLNKQLSVIEKGSAPLLQLNNTTSTCENPLARFSHNINKEGKEPLIFRYKSSDVQVSQVSENPGPSKVEQGSAVINNQCHVEHEDSTSAKEDPSHCTKRWTNTEALNLSNKGDSVFISQTAESYSSSFSEANNCRTKEDMQRAAIGRSLFTAPFGVFCPVFKFGASDFQFKLDASNLANSTGQQQNNRGDCKALHKPMFPLPPPVYHPLAGQDAENVLFSNRAKLYCFERTSSQWKERAFGEIRVLENKVTKLPRLVMWNAINKCCANHWITGDLELKHPKTSNHTWTWRALDYSENKQALLEFAVHFKLKEMAQVFKQVVERVQNTTEVSRLAEKVLCCSAENEKIDQNGDDSPTPLVGAFELEHEGQFLRGTEEQKEEEGDEDVVMLSEVTPTPEQRALALELLLPPTFFCYKNTPGYQSSDDEAEENFETAVKKLYPSYNKYV
ncbi:signaling mucin HKR1-like isoform X3 [Scyliorhinus canicula]|uniref:signaling mucin HKR1-like isoform X3 n=1 Tax=Scyliorhinus canicula TaxID=7830 RepID=UPI0018F395EA|nr:signaling mucin HKR1-like isoform X3 [Scyliorhinus canicula]